MLSYLRDKWQAARLKARYERLVQERILDLLEVAESAGPQPVAEDPGRWALLGGADAGKTPLDEAARSDLRAKARRLVLESPHARNVLRLLEIYTAGPGLRLSHALVRPADAARTAHEADRVWDEFLVANQRHFSFREFARRTWRDGECFLRLFPAAGSDPDAGSVRVTGTPGAPAVRFVDPETIGATVRHPDSHGILTLHDDVETPVSYLRIDPATGELAEAIPAGEIIHTKIGVDSNQKRGVSVFAPVVDVLERFEKWIDTELAARRLQASIVLWRKVHGSPAQAAAFADAAKSFPGGAWERGRLSDPHGSIRRERFRPGTILTTSHGTELQYLQPDTNFGDAVPLGRMVLLCVAAGVGLPEFMLTSDASNANYASTMVAEGPAVKLFQSEQQFFAGELERLWRWVLGEAVRRGRLPADVFDRVQPEWTFPQLVTRDRPRERREDVRLVRAGILSRAEVARRDSVDPAVMRSEIAGEGRMTKHE